ncbi:MAG: hypothetical protein F4Y02_11520 [Chloroflexi bacterium]|nr:hypothetical protein [Chloroflexota bacterium]
MGRRARPLVGRGRALPERPLAAAVGPGARLEVRDLPATRHRHPRTRLGLHRRPVRHGVPRTLGPRPHPRRRLALLRQLPGPRRPPLAHRPARGRRAHRPRPRPTHPRA